MIIDHEKSVKAGEPVPMDGANDETMALRVVTPDGVTGPASDFRPDIAKSEVLEYRPPREITVDYPALETAMVEASEKKKPKAKSIAEWGEIKRHSAWMAMRKGFHYRYQPRAHENTHGDPGPFDASRLGSATGRLSAAPSSLHIGDTAEKPKDEGEGRPPVTLSLVHPDRPLFVVAKPKGVEHSTSAFLSDEDDHENTGTFALPAVWKLTGQKSGKAIAHRSAAHVQKIFNEAGWPIAVWYGEATGTYWVMDERGLHEFDTITTMYQGMGWEAL